jgi:hypothetical protein
VDRSHEIKSKGEFITASPSEAATRNRAGHRSDSLLYRPLKSELRLNPVPDQCPQDVIGKGSARSAGVEMRAIDQYHESRPNGWVVDPLSHTGQVTAQGQVVFWTLLRQGGLLAFFAQYF